MKYQSEWVTRIPKWLTPVGCVGSRPFLGPCQAVENNIYLSKWLTSHVLVTASKILASTSINVSGPPFLHIPYITCRRPALYVQWVRNIICCKFVIRLCLLREGGSCGLNYKLPEHWRSNPGSCSFKTQRPTSLSQKGSPPQFWLKHATWLACCCCCC